MGEKKTQKAQSNLGKKCGTGGINLSDFRLYYQASHQATMVNAQKQKHRAMDQDTTLRDKPTLLQAAFL